MPPDELNVKQLERWCETGRGLLVPGQQMGDAMSTGGVEGVGCDQEARMSLILNRNVIYLSHRCNVESSLCGVVTRQRFW